MASDRVPAIWDGPFDAELPDMTFLQPGDEHHVTAEDLKSGHWKPAGRKAAQTTRKPDQEGDS